MGPAKGKEATTRNPGKYQGFSVGGLILHFEIVILFFFSDRSRVCFGKRSGENSAVL